MTVGSGTLLLIEDNEHDVLFMKRALNSAEITNALQVVADGQSAIDYLAGSGQYADRNQFPLPCLVFLDLKLPVKGGLEVLSWMRQQPALQTIIVIVLTTSREPNDIQTAYRLGGNSYVVKPTDVTRLVEMLRALKHYWLTFNEFAGRC